MFMCSTSTTFKSSRHVLLAALLGLACFKALAAGPTEMEWLVWPDYCKAGFLASDYSAGSPFQGRMPPSQVKQLRASNEATVGIPGVHHFCMGMVYVERSRSTKVRNDYTLKLAINEIEYSYSRIRTTAPMYSLVTAYYGTAYHRQGKREQAIQMWNKGISIQPSARESYLALAEALLSEKKPMEALDVLLRYEAVKEYDSADAEYFLGHTYFELKQYDKAREHADKAYQLGYPFPGLRDKLERVKK